MSYRLDTSERDTMRELSRDECEAYYLHERCPFCAATTKLFRPGPRGGRSINVECSNCLCRLNVLDMARTDWHPWGQLIRAPLANFTRCKPS